MQLTLVFFILGIIINSIITIVLISKNSMSQKLLKEIKTGVQNMVNEIESKIGLAMDVSTDLQEIIHQAQELQDKTIFKKRKKMDKEQDKVQEMRNTHAPDITSSDEIQVPQSISSQTLNDKRNMIRHMLSQNYSVQSITEALSVSVDEVDIIRTKEMKHMKSSKKIKRRG